MKGSSYRDRDYAFGQAMLALRTRIGLTQAGLARLLGVSRRAVGDWEAGSSYPKVEHLKQFILLAIERQAFLAGREAEEVHALWQAARQKVLLDEAWLAARLPRVEAHPAVQPLEETPGPAHALAPAAGARLKSAGGPRLDWDEALAVPTFYGSEWELNLLAGWVVEERCRVVSVLGLGGIGKSALAVSLMFRVAERFEVVIWRSLRDAPACEALLDECLQVLAPQALGEVSISLERRLSRLLEHLRSTRVLLVLDNLEALLEEGEDTGHMRPGYEGYSHLLRRIAETGHQSCLLLTSREKPGDLVSLEGSRSPVRALRLARLELDACEELLAEKDVTGSPSDRARLIDAYGGNPLALKIVAQTIVDLFDGEIAPFLEQGEVIFGGIRELLSEQFARLSALEQCLLLWLAILREPSTLDELAAVLVTPMPRARLLEAVEGLHRRSLIERGQKLGSFMLQSVVLEYATAQLIMEASSEIQEGRLARLIEHGLTLAGAREYVRQAQERLIVAPIIAQLHGGYPQQAAVEEQLLSLLTGLAAWAGDAQGYGPANLVALLRLQRGDLRGLDLSRLALRGVYLQGVEMQDAALSGALIQEGNFTETFGAITAVAISSSGEYWAASSRRGEVWVWAAGGQALHRAWRAHGDIVWAVPFSPDERTLASGSWDGAVKLWDVATGGLLWSGRHASHVNSVAFAPNGSLLASSGNDAAVRLWDVRTGTQVQMLPHPGPVSGVAWSPDGRTLASCSRDQTIWLWDVEKGSYRAALLGHTASVDGLAFPPDSRSLLSGSEDGTLRVWDVAGGQCIRVIQGLAANLNDIDWSPDGSYLVSGGSDKLVTIFDVTGGRPPRVLRGHSGVVFGVGWSSDGQRVASSEWDNVIRLWDPASGSRGMEGGELFVWDPQRGERIHIIAEHPRMVYAVAWGPGEELLVSGGGDGLLRWWDVQRGECVREHEAHQGTVQSLRRSPDGTKLASCGDDGAIMLWDLHTGEYLQTLRRDRPYERLDITGIQGLTEAQKESLLALGAFEES